MAPDAFRIFILPANETGMLIAHRVHEVSPQFVREIESLGFAKPQADQLLAMRVRNLSIDRLINLRVHGIE